MLTIAIKATVSCVNIVPCNIHHPSVYWTARIFNVPGQAIHSVQPPYHKFLTKCVGRKTIKSIYQVANQLLERAPVNVCHTARVCVGEASEMLMRVDRLDCRPYIGMTIKVCDDHALLLLFLGWTYYLCAGFFYVILVGHTFEVRTIAMFVIVDLQITQK